MPTGNPVKGIVIFAGDHNDLGTSNRGPQLEQPVGKFKIVIRVSSAQASLMARIVFQRTLAQCSVVVTTGLARVNRGECGVRILRSGWALRTAG